MMLRTIAAGGLLVTMGCAAVPPEEDVPVHGSTGYRCDASKAKALVGRQATSELAAEAQRLTGSGAVRWLQPGAIVTMDYREDRLNIELDSNGRVLGFRCG